MRERFEILFNCSVRGRIDQSLCPLCIANTKNAPNELPSA